MKRICFSAASTRPRALRNGLQARSRRCGSVATMRRQVRLLARAVPEAAVGARRSAVHRRHRVRGPHDRRARRRDRAFPWRSIRRSAPPCAPARRAAEPVVYTSAACGADLIFIEAAQNAGAEVNIVLPFDRLDFVRTSVASAAKAGSRRFDAALSRATRVIYATEEGHLDDRRAVRIRRAPARRTRGVARRAAADDPVAGVRDRQQLDRRHRRSTFVVRTMAPAGRDAVDHRSPCVAQPAT